MRAEAHSIFERIVPLVFFCAIAIATGPIQAQSYTVLYPFASGYQSPRGLVQASDGNFYGTESPGGTNGLGSVFKVTPAGTLTTIHSFSGSDGENPYGTLVQGTDGSFYGTTYKGGAGGTGTIFRITSSGTLTTLYSFGGSDGARPYAGLLQGTDGNFYGTTNSGGASDNGAVFKITPAGALTTIYSFKGSDGANPYAGLAQGTDGNLYGTTTYGGEASDYGTVFKITPAGALTTLYTFGWGDGGYPDAGLVQGTDGNFYGTTPQGGGNGFGTVFRITPAGTLTTLYSFEGSDGANPYAGLVQGTDGNFYGTTQGGGNGFGTVFRITPAGALTTLYSFEGSDGANLYSGLVQGTDGNFYGTTNSGGAIGGGTVFQITPAGVLSTLYSFPSSTSDGRGTRAGLVQATDGSFYGTTPNGGASDYGTVFKITAGAMLTTLHSFSESDGQDPSAGLVLGTDGNFYGTTFIGGAIGFGTVFRITPVGVLTTLYSFGYGDGADPSAVLVQGTDGNFYGTTVAGGASGKGTVFKITAGGTLTTLHSFSGSDGRYPAASLLEGIGGYFYGTTVAGGASDSGTVFRITPVGALTTLYSFEGYSDGTGPYAALVLGTDGNFYGTTNRAGASDYGTVFKITPAGALTTLHSFSGGDGRYPYASLVEGTGGNFYGTTSEGGTSDNGTIFKITPGGMLTTLHSFNNSDGAIPYAGLLQATDGNFYGTAPVGGPRDGGVVFRLTPGQGPAPTVTGVSPASGPVSGGTVVAISGTDFQPGATVSLGGAAATSVTYLSATTLFAFTPIHVAGAVTVTVTNPDLQAGSLASAFTYMCIWSPMAFNGGAYCVGETISIWTPLVFGATYSWTGPNGFTSSEQNPTIPSATATNAGTYSVTVTVAGCISVPGTTEVVVGPSPPVITAPVTVGQGSPNRLAGVVTHAGSTYAWTITNGTITAGQGTSQVAFTAGAAGTPLTLSVAETNGSGCTSAPATATVTVAPPGSAVLFYTVVPCRQLDTRTGSGTPIAAGGTQTVVMTGTPCGIPATAKAVSVNLTVTEPTAPGYLTIYPADGTQPLISNVNFTAGQTRANNAQLRLSTDGAGAVKVFNGSLGTVHVILDVNGYFQ